MNNMTTPLSPDTPIENLHLSVRSYNCLKRALVNTVGELSALTPEELLAIRNLGVRCFDEITDALTAAGLRLRET